MLTRRIIPCLDILDGRVVKGKQFVDLVDVGDAVEMAKRYSDEGVDELVLLDISASKEGRKPFFDTVTQIAARCAIPLTVGGGVGSVEDILALLRCGADKVSLNSVLVRDPEILSRSAPLVGSQALVAAIDVKRIGPYKWQVYIKGGSEATALDGLEWAKRVVALGAGELLVTSIDQDGTKKGYDLEFLKLLAENVPVPVIASGGAGTREHLLAALQEGRADAVLAASLFHFRELSIVDLKRYLDQNGIPVRL